MGLNTQMWTRRIPVQFICDDVPSLSITTTQNVLANNPSSIKVVTGTAAKVDNDLLGIPWLRGDGEMPPTLQLEWKELGINDYYNLSALRPYFVTFITFRNVGYYGKLVLDGPDSVPGSADIVHVTGNFYCCTPSDDGSAQTVSRISTPSGITIISNGSGTGDIPQASTGNQFYFLTFSSEYGETTPLGPSYLSGPQGDGISIALSWTWPSTPHCQAATIYNCSDVNGDSPMLVAKVPRAFSATWTDYVGYAGLKVAQALPTVNTAYKGSWNAGIWINDAT